MKIKLITILAVSIVLLAGATAGAQNESERWLSVEVTNENGVPLKNACVTFVPKAGDIVFRKGDKRGRVRLKRPTAGAYRVVVKVDGYEAQKKEVTVGAKSESLAFALRTSVPR